MKIYISNLNSSITGQDLMSIFTPFGQVSDPEIVYDLFTGESRGFGYVTMEDASEAKKAITSLDKTECRSFTINVTEAVEKEVHKGSYKVGSGLINEYRFPKN